MTGRAGQRISPDLGFAAALVLVAAFAAADASDLEQPLTAALVLGPFVAALCCTLRQTIIVAGSASALAVLSVSWNVDPSSGHQLLRIAVVLAGSVLAVAGARERARAAVGRQRLQVLADLADVADPTGVDEAAIRIADLVVPDVADACLLDLHGDGRSRRIATRATSGGEELVRRIPPSALAPSADGRPTIRTTDAVELAPLRDAGVRSILTAPVHAQGRVVGAITLGARRRYTAADLPFARALAGRVALALENAGLAADLQRIERRFGVALDEMQAAVSIQRPGQGIVYVNPAAAALAGLPSPAALIGAAPQDIARGWTTATEDGAPLLAEDYPSARLLRGLPPADGPLVIHRVHGETGRENWLSVRATPVHDADGQLEMVVSVTEDITAVKRAERLQHVLADAGRLLHELEIPEQTLQALASRLAPALGDWCAVTLTPGTRVAHAGDDDPGFDARAELASVLAGRGSVLVDEELPSRLHVAIRPPDGPAIGVLSLAHTHTRRRYDARDRELAEELGRRAGLALENARLYRERSRIAAELQTSLLPERLPDVPGFTLASAYRAAGRETWVGGDFYDAFQTPAGWMTVVGDVAGQGAPAAALTAKARHTLRTACMLTGDPVQALALLNRLLAAREQVSMCSVCVALLPRPERGETTAHVVCAGHPRPVRIRSGAATEVGSWGTMLGAFSDTVFSAEPVEIVPGDTLVLYTDGVPDARGADDRFGGDRLRDAVAPATDARDAVARLEAALDSFSVGSQADDTAILTVGRR